MKSISENTAIASPLLSRYITYLFKKYLLEFFIIVFISLYLNNHHDGYNLVFSGMNICINSTLIYKRDNFDYHHFGCILNSLSPIT